MSLSIKRDDGSWLSYDGGFFTSVRAYRWTGTREQGRSMLRVARGRHPGVVMSLTQSQEEIPFYAYRFGTGWWSP